MQKAKGDPNVTTFDELQLNNYTLRGTATSTAPASRPSTAEIVAVASSPSFGPRFHLEGEDYDLCQEEFDKCSEAEKRKYVRMKGIKIMDQGAGDARGFQENS